MDTDKKLSQLLFYAAKGWPVFPCTWTTDANGRSCSCQKGGSCKSPGKHPLTRGGFYDATTDPATIRAWLAQYPLANWGLRTGSKAQGGAGIVVPDIDVKPHADPPVNGLLTWDLLREQHLEPIQTICSKSGSGMGGMHLWFAYPEGHDIPSGTGVLGEGVDIRANSGYIVVPPSVTKAPYTFELNPSEAELAPLPDWILELILAHKSKSSKTPAIEQAGPVVEQGRRHDSLVSLAGSLRRVGLEGTEIEQALAAVRDVRMLDGDHPVTDDEVSEIASWVTDKDREYPHTDLGNAERFLAQNKQDVRYCFAWQKWLIWDGRRWTEDINGEILRRAHLTVRAIYAEASNAEDDAKRKALAKHAIRSEARSKVENMIDMARAYVPVAPDELDRDPWLFNVANGVIDLRTGAIRPHRREYMITKLSDIEFDPNADAPKWEQFIKLITGDDPDLAWSLQLAAGYTLTGSTDEHAVFFLVGDGLNGKSTFTEAQRRLMGDYARRTDIEALLDSWSPGQTASPYVADMKGARYVLASEIPENRRWDESLLKDLTGGDVITARYLFSNPFEFRPSHKLWIYGNHKPKVSGTDTGFWRRMKIIPFAVTIPEDIRRPMSEVLHDFELEMPGILAWAVLGCVSWQQLGLCTAEAITRATVEYRSEQDLVAQYLDERALAHPDYSITKDLLYTDWRRWCEDNGEEGGKKRSKKWFTRQLTTRGYQHGGDGNLSLIGLKLK